MSLRKNGVGRQDVEEILAEEEIERIMEEFAVTRGDVLAALQYAARILEDEEVRAVS